jgi:3-oxoacyl-[acyl-carrier protein] reductase
VRPQRRRGRRDRRRAAARGATAYGAAVDVTDEAALAAFVEDAARELGGLDLVVANAGGAAGGTGLADVAAQDWRTTFDLNVVHAAVLVRAALPHLTASDAASVVVVSSISGSRPQPKPQYAAAKAAEISLAASLARELGPQGIRVNTLSPARSCSRAGAGPAAATTTAPPSTPSPRASSRSAASGRRRRWPTSRRSCSARGRPG